MLDRIAVINGAIIRKTRTSRAISNIGKKYLV